MTILRAAAAATILLIGAAGAALPASAATTITLTGNSGTSGTAGNTRSFSAGTGAGAVTVTASGWTISGTSVTSAYLGTYSNGLGVTNSTEGTGGNGTHTVDNNGSVDFILFQFNKAVSLLSANLSQYGDTDVTFASLSAAPTGSVIPLSQLAGSITSGFISTGGSSNRTATNGTPFFSRVWAISAATPLAGSTVTLDSTVDSFKLRQITVQNAPAVPEPATWAMMLLGFAGIGAAMRRRPAAPVAFRFA